MAVSLVVDTSGSMSGEKIENARLAASSLIETLSDGDLVSIYAFANGVAEVAPPTTVDEDVEALGMSTLSFQDFVRERMLKRRQVELAEAPADPRPLPPAAQDTLPASLSLSLAG
jgi:uncharacterized protein (DUF58 family)